jgi:hypothetical protein
LNIVLVLLNSVTPRSIAELKVSITIGLLLNELAIFPP